MDSEELRDRSRKFYDRQAVWYEATRRPFLLGRRQVIAALGLQAGETVLDVGCGTGWNIPHLRQGVGPGGRVIGLEMSGRMLERARRTGSAPNVVLRQGDASRDDVAVEPLDAALFSYSLSAIPEPERALDNVLRRLRPGGRLGIVDFRVRGAGALDALLLAHGRRCSCDFAVDPVPYLLGRGLAVRVHPQLFGYGYRLVAAQPDPQIVSERTGAGAAGAVWSARSRPPSPVRSRAGGPRTPRG